MGDAAHRPAGEGQPDGVIDFMVHKRACC
jgi:hypothetical protein